MMKKYALSLLVAFCLTGCGGGSTISTDDGDSQEDSEGQDQKSDKTSDNDKADKPDKPGKTDDDKTKPVKSDIPDADNDTIADSYECSKGDPKTGEGCEDTDEDGTPDYLDTDSDNDTVPDSIEAMNGGDPSVDPVTCGFNSIEAFRTDDADMNGIKDADEVNLIKDVPSDIDDDGVPDFCDIDNDGDDIDDEEEIVGTLQDNGSSAMDCNGDSIPDEPGSVENPFDCDDDATPDYNSPDSDGDTIGDKYENVRDSNHDGFLDRYSQDSDGDTIPDAEEKGPNDVPLDSDNDGFYNFQSIDSDNDGLLDALEFKCSDSVYSHWSGDADGDGQSDLAEYSIALANNDDPKKYLCNSEYTIKDYVSFYFELPLSGETSSDTLSFEPSVTKADVFINLDNTGSMQDALTNIQKYFSKVVVAEIQKRVPDSQFGVSIFRDFDAKPVWQLRQAITSDLSSFQQNLDKIEIALDKTDYAEAGYESLSEIATGEVKDNDAWKVASKPEGDGVFGGAGFRKGALPIVIHITDAESHENSKGHNAEQAFKALNERGIRVIHIGTPFTAGKNQPELLAKDGVKMASGAQGIVPVCAYQSDANQWACGVNKCCTNALSSKSMVGVAPNSDNQCVLAINPSTALDLTLSDGTNSLAYETMLAIEALVKYSTYDVATRIIGEPIPEEDQIEGKDNDTSCFIQKVEALSYEKPNDPIISACLDTFVNTQMKAFNNKGYNNGFTDFAVGAAMPESPKSKLSFNVIAQNNQCVKRSTKPRAYNAIIEVYNPTTDMVFASHKVAIIVPGVPEDQVN